MRAARKLSEPQKALLAEIAPRAQPVAEYYPPAKGLVAKGLAEWERGNFSTLLKITAAGTEARALLARTQTEGPKI